MREIDYPAFDADNHYYEALDAFTRHVPKNMQARCVQWAEIDGHQHHIVGGKLAHAVKSSGKQTLGTERYIRDLLKNRRFP